MITIGNVYFLSLNCGNPDLLCRAVQGRAMMDVRFGHKVGQIRHKWDKFGTFSDQIQVYFSTKI